MQNYEQANFLLLGLTRLVRGIPHIGTLDIQVNQAAALARSTRFKINLVLLPLAFAGQQLDQKEIALARVKAGAAVYRLNDLWQSFRQLVAPEVEYTILSPISIDQMLDLGCLRSL